MNSTMVRKASQFSCSLRGCSSYKLQASEEIFCADLICTTTSYCHHLNVAWMCQEHLTFVTSRSMSFKIFFVLIAEITGYSIADGRMIFFNQVLNAKCVISYFSK